MAATFMKVLPKERGRGLSGSGHMGPSEKTGRLRATRRGRRAISDASPKIRRADPNACFVENLRTRPTCARSRYRGRRRRRMAWSIVWRDRAGAARLDVQVEP